MNKNHSLLVVDDERNMRESLKTVLESRGYQVDTVESAEDGLKAVGESDYFMVITDARLEGMSGYDFLRETHERWPDLPVLMMTAYATPKLAVEAIQTGAIDYLSKPFEPEELLHSVNRCAERHELISQNEKQDLDLKDAQEIFGYFNKSYLINLLKNIFLGNEKNVIDIYRSIYAQGVEPKVFITDYLEILYRKKFMVGKVNEKIYISSYQ